MAGSLSIALAQQLDINGQPLAGALLYFFQVGTVATPQNSYQDFGLTLPNPYPLMANQSGRIPNFYLADGQVHARLTDASGVVIFDAASLQVVGPSSGGGGGGGGGSVDPSTIASTGDIKFRATAETLTGWVKLNGQTVGNASSGSSQRSNPDVQALFIYLWSLFSDAHCPVAGGRGLTALADFQVNKTIQVPDWRDISAVGLDDMGNSAKGGILSGNVTSGGGDGPTTPGATGGEANHTLTVTEAPKAQMTFNDSSHSHPMANGAHNLGGSYQLQSSGGAFNISDPAYTTGAAFTGMTVTDNAGGLAHNNLPPFVLVTWYMHL